MDTSFEVVSGELSSRWADSRSLDREVMAALAQVIDPCSVASGIPLSLVDMGLVHSWRVDEQGELQVTLRVTSAGCMMAPTLVSAARAALARIEGIDSVVVSVDVSILWTPEMMSEDAKFALGY